MRSLSLFKDGFRREKIKKKKIPESVAPDRSVLPALRNI
jgi:hypothetical protein